jgi:hypothetical protein
VKSREVRVNEFRLEIILIRLFIFSGYYPRETSLREGLPSPRLMKNGDYCSSEFNTFGEVSMRSSLITRTLCLVFLLLITVLNAVPTRGQSSQPQEAYFMFRVEPFPETFIFKLTDPQRIQQARDILATGSTKIVSGTIIKQPAYYNLPWSFHLDPRSIEFVDFAIELCDSNIRAIEDNRDNAYPGWCPWRSQLLKEVPPPAEPGTGNLAPAISMTHPHADDTYGSQALASVDLIANAADADGEITRVEFSSGGKVIGETTSYPYSFTWHNLTAGSYTVLATATDDNGAKTDSRSVTFLINPGSPMLRVDANTARALAFDSVTLMSEPFPVIPEHFFSADQRTRVTVFGHNLELNSDEGLSAISAHAEDSQHQTYVLTVEAADAVPNFPWLTQVTVKLPDELQGVGDVWLSVSLRGITSNKVLVKIR